MPKKDEMVIANPLSGYTPKASGGWNNSTTTNPDTIDRKGRGGLGGGYDTPEERERRKEKARSGKVITQEDL